MANTNAPMGFIPVKHLAGGIVRDNPYTIANGLNVTIGKGDPVKLTGTGKNITICAPGDTITGIFAGCKYTDPVTKQPQWSDYWPANQTSPDPIEAYVIDDPNVLFEIQVSGTVAAGDIGNNCDLVIGNANTLTGLSGCQVDLSTKATTAKQVRLYELVNRPDNAYGANAKVLVLINLHQYKVTTGV